MCVSIGIGASAAPTHASVIQRRSRGVSTPRRHISPNTNPITPASMYAPMAGGAGVVMMCSYCALASAWRSSRLVHSLTAAPRSDQEIGRAGDAHGGIPPRRVDRRQCGGGVERGELLGREHEVGGGEVVVELLEAARADDRRRDAGLREHPRQRDLRHRHAARRRRPRPPRSSARSPSSGSTGGNVNVVRRPSPRRPVAR